MFINLLRALLLGAMIAPALSSAKPPGALPQGGRVVGTVQGVPVTEDVLNLVQTTSGEPPVTEISEQALQELMEGFAISQWLVEEALRQKLHRDAEVAVSMTLATRQVLVASLLDRTADAMVTEEAVQSWYDAHPEQTSTPAAHVRHILVEEEALAVEVLLALSEGADFAELAIAESVDPGSAPSGGDLGWITREQVVAPFGDAVFEAERSVVGPVETSFGFHVLEVLEARDTIPLKVLRDEIEAELRDTAMRELIERAQGEVVVDIAVDTGP